MRLTMRERLIRSVERSIVWAEVDQYKRDAAHRQAGRVVDDLFEAKASGEAVQRALKVLEEKAG